MAGVGGALKNSGLSFSGSSFNIGSNSIISTGTGSILTGSFSGSFVGTTNLPDLTAGAGISTFTYDGGATANVAVSGAATLVTNRLTRWSGNAFITSSLSDNGTIVSGASSLQLTGASSALTGSLHGTASWAQNAITASYVLNAVSASFATTASYVLNAVSASFATTSSYAFNADLLDGRDSSVFATTGSNQFNGNQAITGSLTVTGQITAQTLNVQQVTSSIVYSSGSNVFGSSLSNTQQLTGSVSVTGSFTVTTTGTELQVTSTGVNLGNIVTDNHNVTGSLRVSGSATIVGNTFITGSTNITGSARVQGSINIGSSLSTISYNLPLSITLPAIGTKVAFLNVGINSVVKVELNGSENGFYQPILLTIARNSTGASITINKDNPFFHEHSNDIAFSSDTTTGDIFAEKLLYTTGRNFRISKVETLFGTATVLNGTLTSTIGVGTDQSVTRIGKALYITGANTAAQGNLDVSGTARIQNNTQVTGSFTVTTGSAIELQVTNLGVNIGNATTDTHNVTGSLRVSGSSTIVGNTAITGSTNITGSFIVTTTGTELQVTSTGVNLGNAITDVHNVTGSLRVSGSNTFVGNQTVTGSLLTTGSNTLIGTTFLTGSLNISGSETIKGYIQFEPVTANINTAISASYIYVSGSTNDLYFSQNSKGYSNTTRLRWLEGNLYTGLLHGGLITTQSSTVYQISSGSGIIVDLNASLNDDPYPVIQFLEWGNLSASIAPLTASYQQAFVGIDSTNNIFAQGTPFSNGQFDNIINIGGVFFQNGSTINAVKTQPSVAYGFEQQQNIFMVVVI